MKRTIRLRESELRRMISESVKRLLSEGYDDVVVGAFDSFSDIESMDNYDELTSEQKIQLNDVIDSRWPRPSSSEEVEICVEYIKRRWFVTAYLKDEDDDTIIDKFSMYLD